jgi:hypothetical protein
MQQWNKPVQITIKQMPQGNNLNRKCDYGYGMIEKRVSKWTVSCVGKREYIARTRAFGV